MRAGSRGGICWSISMLRPCWYRSTKARIARSGVLKVAIPAWLKIARPGSMSAPPTQEVKTGLGLPDRLLASSAAISVGSFTPWGADRINRASISSACRQISTDRQKRSIVASPRMSTGLARLQWAGRMASSLAIVSSLSAAGARP